jgi:hypothetical protein
MSESVSSWPAVLGFCASANSFVYPDFFVYSNFPGGWVDDERTLTTDRTGEQKL